MANNFTPISNSSSQPMQSTLKGKIVEQETKSWARARPRFAPWLHFAKRQVLRRVVRLNQCGNPLRPTQLATAAQPDPAAALPRN
jgi:hypothetical protein